MKNYASKGKRIGLLLAMLFITSWMFAQVTVTGNVRDERDEGAIGATVLLVGSQKGAITDSEGNFKLSVPNAQTAVLQISYVGYETQTIPLKGKTRIRVILKEEANALNEVMVVAYGTQKKETLTGAISSVKTDVLLRSPNASIATSLAGQITGLSSVATSGQPGKEDPAIYIRGVGSLTESASAPLILVDGVERSGQFFPRLALEAFFGFFKPVHVLNGFFVARGIGRFGGQSARKNDAQRQQHAPEGEQAV